MHKVEHDIINVVTRGRGFRLDGFTGRLPFFLVQTYYGLEVALLGMQFCFERADPYTFIAGAGDLERLRCFCEAKGIDLAEIRTLDEFNLLMRASGPDVSRDPVEIAWARQLPDRMKESYGKISLALGSVN